MRGLIAVAAILGTLTTLVWVYRNKIEDTLPGFKTKLWNGVLILFGLLSYFVDSLKLIDWSQYVGSKHVALAGIFVGGMGLLLSWVTRRLDKNGDGVVDERDGEEALD